MMHFLINSQNHHIDKIMEILQVMNFDYLKESQQKLSKNSYKYFSNLFLISGRNTDCKFWDEHFDSIKTETTKNQNIDMLK